MEENTDLCSYTVIWDWKYPSAGFPFNKSFSFMYIGVLPTCLCESVGSPGIGVIGSCELSCECWEVSLGHLKEQPVLLTTGPSFQPSLSAAFLTTETSLRRCQN